MYNQRNNNAPREMFDITDLNITCATCGKQIEKIPFRPRQREDGTYGQLYCRDCNKERMNKGR